MYSRVAPPNQCLEGLATGNTERNSKTKCVEDAKGMKDRHGSQEKPSNVSNETWKVQAYFLLFSYSNVGI